jgi:CheY-like chemotaxis protein
MTQNGITFTFFLSIISHPQIKFAFYSPPLYLGNNITESKMPVKTKKHILVIDDEPAWLKITSHILENHGYDVLTAGSGAEALRALTTFKPDLIFSDVRMPDMNGFDLIDNLKRNPATSSTPVIFFSAIDDYDARKVARTLGAVDYLIKPFNEDEVSSVLSKHLPV